MLGHIVMSPYTLLNKPILQRNFTSLLVPGLTTFTPVPLKGSFSARKGYSLTDDIRRITIER